MLPVVGAVADRSARKKRHDGRLRLGRRALRRAAVLRAPATNWQLGAVLHRAAPASASARCLAGRYDAILCDISDRGRARPGLVARLGARLPRRRPAARRSTSAIVLGHDSVGLDEGWRCGSALLSRGVWWAALHDHPVPAACATGRRATWSPEAGGLRRSSSFGQLFTTLRDLRHYPMTLTFLVAYLFYNDGIQTVIDAASIYGEKELGFEHDGADRDHPAGPVRRLRRRAALRPARRAATAPSGTILVRASCVWMVDRGRRRCSCPASNVALVPRSLGRRRSASCSAAPRRSRGRSSACSSPAAARREYFSLYHACERGTSWFGTLAVRRRLPAAPTPTGPAIFALIVFFVLGALLPAPASTRSAASSEAGNAVPAVV